MFNRFYLRAGAIAVSAAVMTACSGGALNQSIPSTVPSQSQPSVVRYTNPRPMFLAPRYTGSLVNTLKAGALPTWNGSFQYNGHTFNYTMVGPDPSKNNSTTTIPVTIIPLKIVIGATIFAPKKKLSNGQTVLQNFMASPLFNNNVDFVQGGVDVGKTQYIDAFQRANFWGSVKTNSKYHVVLKPTMTAVQTMKNPPGATVGNYFGAKVGLVDYGWMDNAIQGIVTKMNIPPGTLPLFITRNVYETSGGCCIGGWHNYTGTNTYAIATYVTTPGAFSQDVSAFSHELGEWYDDPYVNNYPYCGGLLEVGDPLEGNQNYGGYPYKVNGFTYNLQDLVTLPYFGAPPATSVNGWFTFQGEKLSVCQNGQ